MEVSSGRMPPQIDPHSLHYIRDSLTIDFHGQPVCKRETCTVMIIPDDGKWPMLGDQAGTRFSADLGGCGVVANCRMRNRSEQGNAAADHLCRCSVRCNTTWPACIHNQTGPFFFLAAILRIPSSRSCLINCLGSNIADVWSHGRRFPRTLKKSS
jgi:hypothetical protein